MTTVASQHIEQDVDPRIAERIDRRIAAYLDRLGCADLADAPADLPTLVALHRAHVERVPYETLQIALGRAPGADPAASVAAILGGLGGYCFNLNGAFGWLLRRLGYAVRHHRAGVQSPRDATAVGADGNHLALTVSVDDGDWLVDVGLGSALHEPLALEQGRHTQGPFTYGLRPSDVVPGGWRFDHDPLAGSFRGMDWDSADVSVAEATARHTELSTSPASMFVKVLAVQRRDADGVDLLRSVSLTRIDAAGSHERVLANVEDLTCVLAEVFGLDLSGVAAAELAAVWERQTRAYAAHRSRRASGG